MTAEQNKERQKSMSNILLLEDDLSLINGLSFAFKKQGFELNIARTLKEAEKLWTDGKYDLLVLDVSLPDGSGFEFCQRGGKPAVCKAGIWADVSKPSCRI